MVLSGRGIAPAVAADCWTFPAPSGPAGSFTPFLPFHWGVWEFSQNKSAGKDLLEWLMQREQIEPGCVAAEGYDIPPLPQRGRLHRVGRRGATKRHNV